MKTIADNIGRGLFAGVVGTAAMTVSSTLEAKWRGRAPSDAPARATAKVLGIAEFEDDLAKARFSDLSHWGTARHGECCGACSERLACPPARPRPCTGRPSTARPR